MPSAFPGKMFQQAELDNYKLQVELLQKKLERSEEQRQQLEDKYEKIQKKRNEHEKSMKTKSRLKFEQFLDEQRERNERNKTIVKMLENIDQQASTLATRTERLKIMKLQYELYFAKLLQSHAMRSLQNSPRYSILPINQIQSQQSVIYPTIPLQTTGVPTIPLNPTMQTTNIYQNPDNFQQHQRIPAMTINNNNIPNSGSDNWNTILMTNPNNNNPNPNQISSIPGNYIHNGNELIYRYPNQMDYYNGGQIIFNPNTINHQIPTAVAIAAPNQLGLPIRGTTVPLMSPSDFHDSLNNPILTLQNNNNNYPNQIHNQQQRIPNKYTTKSNVSDGRHNNDRDELQDMEDCKFYDQNTPMSDRDQLKLNQFRKLQENIKSIEKPTMQPSQKSNNKNQYDFGKIQNDSDRDDDTDEPYKNNPDIFYRKEPISGNQPREQLSVLNNNDNGKSSSSQQNSYDNLISVDGIKIPEGNTKNLEKSQSINLSMHITEGPKQKITENDLILSELQEQQPQLRQYQSFDKQQSISSQLEKNKEPINWNFNGRNNSKPQSDQFARKEKISIENIENAIYGELINPEKQIHQSYMPVETLKNQVRPEPLTFKETIERENYQEEKSDLSSEKSAIIDNSISSNKLDLSSPKNQIKPQQNINEIENKDKNLYNDPIITSPNQQNIYSNRNIPQNQSNLSKEILNKAQNEQNLSKEIPMIVQNQKLSEEYPQNYDFSEPTTDIQNTNVTANDSTYDNYNNYQQEQESTVEYPSTENTVQNYETDLTQSFGQPADNQETLEQTVTPTVQSQDVFENQQYEQNYQFQADQTYPQQEYTEQSQQQNPDEYNDNYIQNINTEYQNYPNQEYQGAYDPNAYDYNYDQQQNYQDPNQQYTSEGYDQNYQPEVVSENFQNYDQQEPTEILTDQTDIVSAANNYVPQTDTLEHMQIADNSEISENLQPSESNLSESKNLEDVNVPNLLPPPVKVGVKPILSKDKSVDLESKKKKKVNFVDSSETDSSSSAPKPDIGTPNNNDESDFDFSSTN